MSIGYLKAYGGLEELLGMYTQKLQESPSEPLKKGKKQIQNGLLWLLLTKEELDEVTEKALKESIELDKLNLYVKSLERKIKTLEQENKNLKENINGD
jgi:BMFP domain-containing protein YqiC